MNEEFGIPYTKQREFFKNLTDYVKEIRGLDSYKKIADSLDISNSYFYSMRGKSIGSINFDYAIQVCKNFDVGFENKNGKIVFKDKFNIDEYCYNYFALVWVKSLNKIKIFKFSKYIFNSWSIFDEAFDYQEGYNYKVLNNFGDSNIRLFNEENSEFYNFELFERLYKDDTQKEFFLGLARFENLFGRLMLIVPESEFNRILSNIDIVEVLLRSKKLQETISSQMVILDELFSVINNFLNKKKTIQIELPIELLNAYQQFLTYFEEFVFKTKGHKIKFDVLKREEHLEIDTEIGEDLNFQELGEYLQEYMGLTKQNLDNIRIEVNNKISDRDFDLMLLNLKQQISHLNNSLELAQYRNKTLEADKQYLQDLIMALTTSPKRIGTESGIKFSPYERIKTLLSKSRIEEALNMMIENFNNINNKKALKETIVISSKFYSLQEQERLGILNSEERTIEQSKIINSLLNICESY